MQDKDIDKLIEEDRAKKPMYANAEYIYLDNNLKIDTSNCKHNVIEDLPNHFVCTKCGLGKYNKKF